MTSRVAMPGLRGTLDPVPLRVLTLLALLAALVIAGCGEDAEPEDNAVEAQEQNTVEIDGISYRVNLFRQLNPRVAPDDALYDGPPPGDGEGLYGAFLKVCNESDTAQEPISRLILEDAFGNVYPRIELDEDNEFAYSSRPLQPGECLPAENTAANRTSEGAVVLYEVPFDQLGNRPFVLEFGEGEDQQRIQLDL